jgi:hypothetical protein
MCHLISSGDPTEMPRQCPSGHPPEDDTHLAATAIMPGFQTLHPCRDCAAHPIWRDTIPTLGTLPAMRLVPGPAWSAVLRPAPLSPSARRFAIAIPLRRRSARKNWPRL